MEDRGKGREGKGREGMKGWRTYLYVDECGTEHGVGFKRGLVYIFTKDNTHFPSESDELEGDNDGDGHGERWVACNNDGHGERGGSARGRKTCTVRPSYSTCVTRFKFHTRHLRLPSYWRPL